MKDNIYTLLNDMDAQVESYERSAVSPEEMKRWKAEFRKRNNIRKKRHIGRYAVAVVVVLVLGLAMGPFQRETYAQMKVVTSSVQEWIGIKKDLSSYETIVGQTLAKDGVTITVNDVVVDGKTMLISYTVTTAEEIDTIEKEMEYRCFVDVQVNGKSVYGGMTGGTEKVDGHNLTSVDEIILEDVDIAKENDYKLVFYIENHGGDDWVVPKKIGTVKFVASGEKLQKETTTIPLDAAYEFPNGEKINFTKYTYNAIGPKVYCESETVGFDYDVWLMGQDNLGNEIIFYLTHFDEDGGWFVLMPDMYIHEDASSLTLSVNVVEFPEESGEIGNDYQVIGEPFTIELK